MDRQDAVRTRGPVDRPLTDAQRFTVYRVRFQVLNDSDASISILPVLEVSGSSLDWTAVPLVDPVPGAPFYQASDNGSVFQRRTAPIAVSALRLGASRDPGSAPAPGRSAAGMDMPAITLGAHRFTEIEFAVRATVAADWKASYAFRLLDGAEPIDGAGPARLVMGAKPPVVLSPGQRRGEVVADPVPRYRLDPSIGSTDLPIATASGTGRTVSYALRMPLAAPGDPTSPHVQIGLASDACAACHTVHQAQGPLLFPTAGAQSNVCFTCHDGTGASTDVQSDWSSAAIPTNDPSTSSWYSHPATTDDGHTSALEDEFGGVLNRHAVCADCHQPHLADGTASIGSVVGWSSSGAIAGAGAVTVTNGAAGAGATYAWKLGSTLEYELCFKCHSGFTQLLAQDPTHPSRWALDKALEFNPANVSYHPVEAAGKNQSNAMALSLAGTSPYKLWQFSTDSTIRCVHCHGDSAKANPASPPDPGSQLDNHSSPNRGILIAPYRDRLLNSAGLYNAQSFALCYVCHAEAPMADDSGDVRQDTNFSFHGYHLGAIAGSGTARQDIDVPNSGQGNALCAECHFRIHSSALAVNGQPPATGLVNFAPNVAPLPGSPMFKAATPTSMGTCTLVCHGKSHVGYGYDYPTPP